MRITSLMMSDFITQNPIRKVVFTPMLMGEINARLYCENDIEITIDIHDPFIIKFFKLEIIIGLVLVTSVNGVRCNYSLPIKDTSIKRMIFNGIREERKNRLKREENLFAKEILKTQHIETFVTEIDGVQFIELKNYYDSTR